MRAVALGATLGIVAASGLGELAAQSAAPEQEVTVLTLQEALELAAQFNPQYRQALNRVELEIPQRREALGAFLPSLRMSYNTGQRFAQERTAVDFYGNPIENEQFQTVTTSNSGQSATLSLSLFEGGRRFHAYSQARGQADVDRLGAERDLNGVLAEVQRQFLIVQRRKARLAVEEALLVARERGYELAERRFELAAIGRSDLLGAELELGAQRVTVRDAQGQAEQGMLALRKAIGDPSLRRLDVEEQLPEPFDPASLDLAALVAEGLSRSPAIGAADAARAVQRSALNSVKATRWPTLSLSSSFSRGSFGRERTALFKFNPEGFNSSLGINISIPLFRQFQTTQQIASAEVELRNAAERLRQAEMELDEQVRTRYVDLETAWANVGQQEIVLEVAGERLRIVQEEYRLATKSIEELRAAIREEAEAQRDLVQQRFEFAAALVGLYEAAGIVAGEAELPPRPEQD